MTSSGSVSQFVTKGGFAQNIPNPNNFGSSVLAENVSVQHTLVIPIGFAVTDYVAYLPLGALLTNVQFNVSTNFTSGATLEVSSLDPTSAAGATPTVAPIGITGSSTFSYKVSAQVGGKFGLATAAGTSTTSNAVLGNQNYNAVTIGAVSNATLYAIYRTAAPAGYPLGLIGYSVSTVFIDIGSVFANPNALVPPAAGDILASHAIDAGSSNNIPLKVSVNSPIQGATNTALSVQQIVLTLTGTTATAGAGLALISYINTVAIPAQN